MLDKIYSIIASISQWAVAVIPILTLTGLCIPKAREWLTKKLESILGLQKIEQSVKEGNKVVEGLLSDDELVKTAKLFFDNNLNISTASKVGFMHRNTLIYRLDKIKKLIGLDIRNFNDAVVFENMLLFYEKYKKVD